MPKVTLPHAVKLTDQATLDATLAVLEQYFDLSADGYLCQTRDLWQVLVSAAVQCTYIETVCNDLATAPTSETVWGYLNDQLTPNVIRRLRGATNRALASQLPLWLRDHPKAVALDLHDEAYYGKDDDPDDPNCWVCRGEARAGTTRFYRCATAYVMHHDVRFTLAVEFVRPGEDLIKVVKRLLRRVKTLQIKVKRYYLDKGFCTIPVLQGLLAEPPLAAIIAAPIRGKANGRGTRALCQGRKSYRSTHTFRSAEYGEVTVPVMVVRTREKRRDGRAKWVWLVYVVLNAPHLTARQVRKAYRRRFGIESSYRLLEQVRGRTTARNAALRFLWMGIALVLGNIWIALHWKYLQRCGSGPRRVARETFILACLARFLRRAVEAIYGVVSVIDPPNVKPAKFGKY